MSYDFRILLLTNSSFSSPITSFFLFSWVLYTCPWQLWASLLGHMAQMLALGFDCWVEKPCYRQKTSLVLGGTWTQVLADSMVIAVSALNHEHFSPSSLASNWPNFHHFILLKKWHQSVCEFPSTIFSVCMQLFALHYRWFSLRCTD